MDPHAPAAAPPDPHAPPAAADAMGAAGVDAVPPVGDGARGDAAWLTAPQAAARLGVTLQTLSAPGFSGRATLRAAMRYVPGPAGGRRARYPVDVVERVAAALALPRAARMPEGWLDKEAACARLGVSYPTLRRWEREGLVAGGFVPGLGRVKGYAAAEIGRLVAECGALTPPYPDPQRPGAWRVPLHGRGIRRREAIVDAADVPMIEGRRIHWSERGREGAAQVMVWTGDEHVRLRQWLLGVRDAEARVGHRNGDPLDCRRANLVVRTRQQVERQNPKRKQYGGRPCSSRFKGVCLERRTGRWRAGLVIDGRTVRLGRFHDELAAAEAYDAAARELFGEHARLNFPDESAGGVDAWLERETAPALAA